MREREQNSQFIDDVDADACVDYDCDCDCDNSWICDCVDKYRFISSNVLLYCLINLLAFFNSMSWEDGSGCLSYIYIYNYHIWVKRDKEGLTGLWVLNLDLSHTQYPVFL